MQKTFVLDTNILIGTSGDVLDSLFATDNHVVITHTTLDELDRHKGDPGEKGYAVRESIRKIFAFKDKRYGDYENGYHTPGGGTFRIELDHIDGEYLPPDWDRAKNDNKILSAAAWLSHTLDEQVILITNDAGMYMDALMAGLKVQNYKDEQVNADQLYMGRDDFDISPAALQRLFKEKTLPVGKVLKKKDCPLVLPNEFLTLHCGNQAPPCFVDSTPSAALPERTAASASPFTPFWRRRTKFPSSSSGAEPGPARPSCRWRRAFRRSTTSGNTRSMIK